MGKKIKVPYCTDTLAQLKNKVEKLRRYADAQLSSIAVELEQRKPDAVALNQLRDNWENACREYARWADICYKIHRHRELL